MQDNKGNRGSGVNQASEEQVLHNVGQTFEAQHLFHWLALRRATMAPGLVVALGLYGISGLIAFYPGLPRRALSARCDHRRDPGLDLGQLKGVGGYVTLS
jgi:hypothetical protein